MELNGLSIGGLYLLFFMVVRAIEISIIGFSKHIRQRKTRNRGSNIARGTKMAQTFLDPRKSRSKIPIYMILFAIVGFTEAYLKVVEGMLPDDLMIVLAFMIFLIYLLMATTIRSGNHRLFYSIMAMGFLVIFITNYFGVMFFTEQVSGGLV